jgi:hypothetical protein
MVKVLIIGGGLSGLTCNNLLDFFHMLIQFIAINSVSFVEYERQKYL